MPIEFAETCMSRNDMRVAARGTTIRPRPRDLDTEHEDLFTDPGRRDLWEDAEARDLRGDPGIQDLIRDLGVREALRLGVQLTWGMPATAEPSISSPRSGGFVVSRRRDRK